MTIIIVAIVLILVIVIPVWLLGAGLLYASAKLKAPYFLLLLAGLVLLPSRLVEFSVVLVGKDLITQDRHDPPTLLDILPKPGRFLRSPLCNVAKKNNVVICEIDFC